jgi:hypothetical protein
MFGFELTNMDLTFDLRTIDVSTLSEVFADIDHCKTLVTHLSKRPAQL